MIENWYASELDLELAFCTDVLGLQSLHYGYSDDPAEVLTLARVPHAQARYTQVLLDAIPPDVAHVLDVGCGIGDNAHAMLQRGLRVTALSPDAAHGAFFAKPALQAARFVRSRFEDFAGDGQVDLVLMSESQNYFAADVGFGKAHHLLRPGGWLLVCGMLRIANTPAFASVTHVEAPYLQAAKDHGFALRDRLDITQNVLPTLAFAKRTIDQHARPAMRVLDLYLSRSAPLTARLAKWWAARAFKKPLDAVLDYYVERTDPDSFKQHVRYLRLLFQRA